MYLGRWMPWSLPSSDEETRSRGSSPDRATDWEATLALVEDSILEFWREQHDQQCRESALQEDTLRFERESQDLQVRELERECELAKEREIPEPVSR